MIRAPATLRRRASVAAVGPVSPRIPPPRTSITGRLTFPAAGQLRPTLTTVPGPQGARDTLGTTSQNGQRRTSVPNPGMTAKPSRQIGTSGVVGWVRRAAVARTATVEVGAPYDEQGGAGGRVETQTFRYEPAHEEIEHHGRAWRGSGSSRLSLRRRSPRRWAGTKARSPAASGAPT